MDQILLLVRLYQKSSPSFLVTHISPANKNAIYLLPFGLVTFHVIMIPFRNVMCPQISTQNPTHVNFRTKVYEIILSRCWSHYSETALFPSIDYLFIPKLFHYVWIWKITLAFTIQVTRLAWLMCCFHTFLWCSYSKHNLIKPKHTK